MELATLPAGLTQPDGLPDPTPPPPHGRTQIIPAERATRSSQFEELADQESALFDLENGPGGRFDTPEPLQLETRGLTSHAADTKSGDRAGKNQGEFWRSHTAHKFSVAAKLREAGRTELAEGLEDCHSTFTVALCPECGRVDRFPNRCDRHYCPECQPRLARERRDSVEWWTKEVHQPKHVVLTLKNIPGLTKAHVQEAKEMLANLRRRAFTTGLHHWWEDHHAMDAFYRASENGADDKTLDALYHQARRPLKEWQPPVGTGHTVSSHPWKGGFYGLEITKERKGYHIHFHLLVDSRFIDGVELSRAWNLSSRGYGYIVKVIDARDADYLSELTKYTVKGSQLAEWEGAEIAAFIDALDGVRTFGVFGSLYGKRTEFAEWLTQLRDHVPACECGCADLRYFTEAEWLQRDLQPNTPARARPPTPDHEQLDIIPQASSYYQDERNFLP